jgi:hypothetical protein
MLDNGYVYPADVRMDVYRSDSDWLMIIEVLGAYSPRVSGFTSFQNCLHIFGSNPHRQPGTCTDDFLYPIEGCPEAPLFEDEYEWFARDDAQCVIIRGNKILLDLTPAFLRSKGIELLAPPRIDPPAILRSLLPEHRDLLLASDIELASRNPQALPLWLRLHEWHHPNLAADGKPSDSRTFNMLAAAIASGDLDQYRPSEPPNTHWRNWPEGGTL